jgi:hypothetical protein
MPGPQNYFAAKTFRITIPCTKRKYFGHKFTPIQTMRNSKE